MHKHKHSMSLAEVLLTLGIIAVIAAFTIPALVNQYRKNVVETRLEAFYSQINQAIKLSEIDNGNVSTWTYPADYYDYEGAKIFFDNYLKKYLANSGVQENHGTIWPTRGVLVYLNNGSAFNLSGLSGSGIWVTYYPVASKQSIGGVDVFLFILDSPKSLFRTPAGGLACSNLSNGSRRDCSDLIMKNNWKIPDNYPWFK